MTSLRFVHISDTHIGPTADYELWGYRPFAMLEALVEHINALPFTPDFVLHTGDLTQDASDESYQLAFSALNRLKSPAYYLPGNHDNPSALELAWKGNSSGINRVDYIIPFETVKIKLLAYDTRGDILPGERLPPYAAGMIADYQLDDLRNRCSVNDGNRFIIALHHQPIKLDSTWLDEGFDDDGTWETMMLKQGDAFLEAIAPARDRICGVFFGHVHRGFQVKRNGILFCSAPSALLQFKSYPGQAKPVRADDELPGFNVVTIQDGQTIVRSYTFPRPLNKGRF
jgi:3',5'-cyclic-AMP phosphodiesterase